MRWEHKTSLDAEVGERGDGGVGRLQALLLLLLEGELRKGQLVRRQEAKMMVGVRAGVRSGSGLVAAPAACLAYRPPCG